MLKVRILQILLVISAALCYIDIIDQTDSKNEDSKLSPLSFRGFDSITEKQYKPYQYGFPAGIYGSSIMPISLWFMHWSDTLKGKAKTVAVLFENTMHL